jgi:hypothetical protein
LNDSRRIFLNDLTELRAASQRQLELPGEPMPIGSGVRFGSVGPLLIASDLRVIGF